MRLRKRGIRNEFGEKIGSVEWDGGNLYYNIYLYGRHKFESLTFDEFWNLMDDLDLEVDE